MQSKTRSATPRDDIRKLSSTLTRLLMPTWLRQAGVIAVVLILWLWIAQQILRLGGFIRYDGLKALGPEFVRIMTDINPYLWWGVIAILSLIVLSVTRNWFINSTKRSKSILVSVAEVQKLCNSLSTEALEVLQWVWDANAEPVSIGDLQATRRELRSGRIRKLAMAQAQAQTLSQVLTGEPAQEAPVNSPAEAARKLWASRNERSEPALLDSPTPTKSREEPML